MLLRRVLAVLAALILLAGCVSARKSATPARATVHRSSAPSTTTTTTVPPTTTTTMPPASPGPAAQPQAPVAPVAPGTYTVQSGDTLFTIATAHGLDWPGMCAYNHLADCGRIYPGQVLTLKSEPVPQPAPAPAQASPSTATEPAGASPSPPGFGCADALAYLAANAAPGYTFGCAPHSALGHYGYTCDNVPGVCPGTMHIQIACPAPFVYENEAANSQPPVTQRDPHGEYDARYPCNDYA